MDGAAGEFERRGGGGGVEEVGCARSVAEEVLDGEGKGDVGLGGGREMLLEVVVVVVDGCGDRLDVLEGEAGRGAEVEGVFEVGSGRLRRVSLKAMGSRVYEGGGLPEYLASQVWCAGAELTDAAPQVEHAPQPVKVHETALVLAVVAFVQAENQDHNHGLVGRSVSPGELRVDEAERDAEMVDSGGVVV